MSITIDVTLQEAGSLYLRKDYPRALEVLDSALDMYPQNTALIFHRGLVHEASKQYAKAIKDFSTVIDHNPSNIDAIQNLGGIYIHTNQLDKAEKTFLHMRDIAPDNLAAIYNLGIVYDSRGDYTSSLEYFHMLTENYQDQSDVSISEVWNYIGNAYDRLNKLDDAARAYKKSLELDDSSQDLFPLYHVARKLCDWSLTDELEMAMDKNTNDTTILESPFSHIQRSTDLESNLQVAQRWSNEVMKDVSLTDIEFTYDWKPHTKIRLGYTSCDIGDHPVTSQIRDLFALHDKNTFEVYLYSYGQPNGSSLRQSISKDANHFVDMYGAQQQDIAKRINNDEIDILIDLVGYATYQKTAITAYHPAPIQIQYLGYPGTMGASYIDYLIADKTLIPQKDRKYYSEDIVYMPHCYQMCSPQIISKKNLTREKCGLPDEPDSIILAAFNRPSKIQKNVFNVWLDILSEHPNTYLWLYVEHPSTRMNLLAYAQRKGISKDRIIFARQLPLNEHLRRLQLADIALDTYIYSGGASTANALWSGVPVITLQGNHYLSRMSSSIIHTLGLSECVSHTIDEYHNSISSLISNPIKLHSMKSKVASLNKTSPLFDSDLWVKDYENKLNMIYKEHKNEV